MNNMLVICRGNCLEPVLDYSPLSPCRHPLLWTPTITDTHYYGHPLLRTPTVTDKIQPPENDSRYCGITDTFVLPNITILLF